nr:MAG TPA: hypothetical protein [Caudoviricetes sp.]
MKSGAFICFPSIVSPRLIISRMICSTRLSDK